jgi:hypothetical protein
MLTSGVLHYHDIGYLEIPCFEPINLEPTEVRAMEAIEAVKDPES